MRYEELVQFQPIESVVELRSADAPAKARELVETFVISPNLAEGLIELVIPHLQFDAPIDNKALLVVGNYGTGKSHLMALLSAVCEHADLASRITNPVVAEKAKSISGRFKVVRSEIGAVEMPLRDIVVTELEAALAGMGISFRFPDARSVTNNKDGLRDMMAAFEAVYPEQGLVLFIDELLDYLATLKDQPLRQGLNFLREVGEVCKDSRFRFVAGVQESLFDNAKFQFAAETLRRVHERFEQARIVRQDVAHVVAERLLKKTPVQQAWIREHLSRFVPLYPGMGERIEEYVRLFPVHPAYLATFERVWIAEKREILRTLSRSIRTLASNEVPADAPGLIAYDTYWGTLCANSTLRANPDVREVMDKSAVLEDRIQHAFTKPLYQPMALRIVHALSVQRLTTADVRAKIGVTVEELRDDLCVLMPLPKQDAALLGTMVRTTLREILSTVGGQFLSHNEENGQYYLDLAKDIDYDTLIERKADTIGPEGMNRAFFSAVIDLLARTEVPPYRSGFNIWEHALMWQARQVERAGYLFLGSPDERSNTQPPRDFYVYFLPPFEPGEFRDERRADEVFFRLGRVDETLQGALKRMAAARELGASAGGPGRRVYDEKAGEQLRLVSKWFKENGPSSVEVSYQGVVRTLAERVSGKLAANAEFRDRVDVAAGTCLAPRFEEVAPKYPTFTIEIKLRNLAQTAQEALRWVGNGLKTNQGRRVLEALELLDGETLRPARSPYAKAILDALAAKGEGQVLNRSELVVEQDGVAWWMPFRIEPEFLAVVLGALVNTGDAEVALATRRLDASTLDQLARLSIDEAREFRSVSTPRGLPLAALQELFDLLDIPRARIVNPNTREDAVRDMVLAASRLADEAVVARRALEGGLSFWGAAVFSPAEFAARQASMSAWQELVDAARALNTPAKLRNFRFDVESVRSRRVGKDACKEIGELTEVLRELAPVGAWITTAETMLPVNHPWLGRVQQVRAGSAGRVSSASALRALAADLAALRGEYRDAYLALHKRARLGAADDRKLSELTNDARLRSLQKLATIDIMPAGQLEDLKERLRGLRSCVAALTPADLNASPECPDCRFKPVNEPSDATAKDRLAAVDADLDATFASWIATITAALREPAVTPNTALVGDPAQREAVQRLAETGVPPDRIDDGFVSALRDVLKGLVKVLVTAAAIRDSLVAGGTPCTPAELEQRFHALVTGLTRGHDAARVRIVLE